MSQSSIHFNITSFCYRSNIPFPAAGTIYGNTDPGARQLLHLMYAVAEELREASCWTQQKKIHTFSTESGRSKYKLPNDFYAASPFTAWNNDENSQLIGALPDFDFTSRLYGGIGSVTNFEYRFFGPDSNVNSAGGQFNVYPTPTSVIECSFEYLSRNLFTPPHWTPSTVIAANKYRFSGGNNYYTSAGGTTGSTAPSSTATSFTDGSVTWSYDNLPYEVINSDSDICIFDDELVKLGLRAKWRNEKGEENADAAAEFKSRIEKAKSRLQGTKHGSMSRVGGPISFPRQPSGGSWL